MLAGAADRLVPEQNVAYACSQLTDCSLEVIGVEQGFAADYGHIDTVLGPAARAEIYPIIGEFLDAQVTPVQGLAAGE